jgi:thymidylate kinase
MFSVFQHDVIRRQINIESRYGKRFISDRSTCDNICYYLLNNNDSKEVVKHYRNLALNHYKKSYDLIVYFPIMFQLEDDGLRNKDEKYRYEIDKLIKKYMNRNKNLYILKSEGLENRVNELTKVINEWKIKLT